MRIKKMFLFCIAFLIIFSPLAALAQNPCSSNDPATNKPNLGGCVNQVYIWSIGAAGLLALIMMIIGGYIYMTAAGNAQQAAKGKDFIISSLVGVVLLLSAFLLLKTINPQLVQFNTSSINSTQTP